MRTGIFGVRRSGTVAYFGAPLRRPRPFAMADPNRPAGAPDAGTPGPRMEHDLRAIREAYNVSLDTVEHETRMPPDILRRFEAGQLVGDANYNEVYLRNLLRSYARALGISHQEVERAYEAAKAGSYDGSLRRLYLEGKDAAVEPPRPAEGPAPAVAALGAKGAKPEREAPPARPNEHFPKERVKSARTSAAPVKPIEKSWGMVIVGTVIGVLAIGAVLWFLFREPGPEPERGEEAIAADTSAAEPTADTTEAATAPPQADASPAPQLSSPIAVTVIAEGGALQGFRVTEVPDIRRPYWLEQGAEQTFESEEEVVLWGEGEDPEGLPSSVRLRMQGLEWDPPDGQVLRIDRARGQALLDSLHRAQVQGGTSG